MRLLFYLTLLATAFISCTTSTKPANTKNNGKGKRRPATISIESPITASLEVVKEQEELVAILAFKNNSNSIVKVDRCKMGGDSLQQHVFHLSPLCSLPNLAFNPFKLPTASGISENYIEMNPQEVIITRTKLMQYYNFKQLKCSALAVSYVGIMKYLDGSNKQVIQKDVDGIVKPVDFYIFSNSVELALAQ